MWRLRANWMPTAQHPQASNGGRLSLGEGFIDNEAEKDQKGDSHLKIAKEFSPPLLQIDHTGTARTADS